MLVQHYAGDAGAVRSLSFHPNGNFILSTCDDANLRIWDIREGHILYTLPGHEGVTTCAEFTSAGEHFASGSLDEHVMLWLSNLPNLCHTYSQEKYDPSRQPLRGSAENYDPSRQSLHTSAEMYDPSRQSLHASAENHHPLGMFLHDVTSRNDDFLRQYLHAQNKKGHGHRSQNSAGKKLHNHEEKSQKKDQCAEKTQIAGAPSSNTIEDSSNEIEAMEKTLEHLVNQVDVLTKTISLFGDRLSHMEDKGLHLEKEKNP